MMFLTDGTWLKLPKYDSLYRYIDDCITKEEALSILRKGKRYQEEREKYVKKKGFPAYTTEVGWLGYEDDKIRALSKKYLEDGFTMFKMKVRLFFTYFYCISSRDFVLATFW